MGQFDSQINSVGLEIILDWSFGREYNLGQLRPPLKTWLDTMPVLEKLTGDGADGHLRHRGGWGRRVGVGRYQVVSARIGLCNRWVTQSAVGLIRDIGAAFETSQISGWLRRRYHCAHARLSGWSRIRPGVNAGGSIELDGGRPPVCKRHLVGLQAQIRHANFTDTAHQAFVVPRVAGRIAAASSDSNIRLRGPLGRAIQRANTVGHLCIGHVVLGNQHLGVSSACNQWCPIQFELRYRVAVGRTLTCKSDGHMIPIVEKGGVRPTCRQELLCVKLLSVLPPSRSHCSWAVLNRHCHPRVVMPPPVSPVKIS